MRYTNWVTSGLLALALASSPALIFAQTITDPAAVSTGTASEALIKENLFSVAPVMETELSAETAIPLELEFTATPNTSEAVDMTGVSAEGFTRKVTVGGDEIAQVVVTRLKKDTNYVDLTADRFTSQFGVESDRLMPTTAISVNGDEAEFVRAIAQLSSEEPQVEEQEAEADRTVEDDSSVDEAGNSEGENPVAGGYETPDRLDVEEEEERDPNVTYSVTTEGCEHQVDLVSGVVRQQSLSRTLEDGVITSTEACSPNGTVWPIQKSYDACEDIVDLDAMVAKPQFESFYIDDASARYEVAGCQVDEGLFYVINEDFDACSLDMNLEGKEVTFLSRLTYRTRGGTEVEVQDCSPSERSFDLARDYNVCSDFIDMENGKANANAQYSLYYVDEKATRHVISECIPDDEKSFEIVEKRNCTFDFDLENGKAIVNTSLVYTTDRNVEVSVRECAPSETIQPIQMTSDVSNCSMRHDFANGVSTEMAMWTYEYEGQLYQATPCITTDTTYTHMRVFQQNGTDVCPAIVDLVNGQAARQYRTEITVEGQKEIVAGCQPDEANTLGLEATVEGCEDPASFDHDLVAGLSYGRERFFYNAPGQGRVYVTGCQASEQVFTHSIEPAGWKYNDQERQAQQLVDVTINVNGSPFTVASSYLQPGTSAVAYTFARNDDTPNMAAAYYEGCEQMVPTSRTAVYLRPDGSSYTVPLGEGETVSAGDFCQRMLETRTVTNWGIHAYLERGVIGIRTDTDYQSHSRRNHQNAYWITVTGGNARIESFTANDGKVCHFYYIARDEERVRITYPDGEIGYTDWVGLEEYDNGSSRSCG